MSLFCPSYLTLCLTYLCYVALQEPTAQRSFKAISLVDVLPQQTLS